MPWLRGGTVVVTNGSTTVVGTNADFAANSKVGDAFIGPDGFNYEIGNVASATVISIIPAYKGPTASGVAYAIMPVQGYPKALADAFNNINLQWGVKLAALGSTGNYETLPVAKGGTGLSSLSTVIQGLLNDADAAEARTTLVAAKSGANDDILALSGMTTALTTGQGGTGAKSAKDAHISLNMRGIRNMLINADFMVNQVAYGGGATTAAGQYIYDMWKVNVSGQSAPLSASGISNTVTAPAGGLVQIIEALNVVGGICTLSWSGTATASVTQASTTTPLTSGGQVTLVAGAQCFVTFSGGTVKEPQLEAGPFQTRFDQMSPALSLIECMRYFERLDCCLLGYGNTNDLMGGSFYYKVRKRTVPSAVLVADGNLIANLNVGALSQQVYQDLIVVYRNVGSTGHSRWSQGYNISARL